MWLSPRFLCPFRVPNVSFVKRDGFSVRVTKITSIICVSWTHRLPFWFWSIFNSMKWPYQNGTKQVNLNHVILWIVALPIRSLLEFCWTWIFLSIKLSWHQCYMQDNLDDSIDFVNFSVRCCLPLIQKDSATHMRGLAVYVRERLPCAGDLFPENSVDSILHQNKKWK